MLGRRTQRGLFDADYLYAEVVPQQSLYTFLAEHRRELFRDEDFAEFYAENVGRPGVPPSLLAATLVLQTYARVSDREAKERADFDLRWKVALGVGLDERPFAKSTLQLFRAQLVVHERAQALFARSLELAAERGLLRSRRLRLALDTTAILGRGAVKDTYNLLGDGIVRLARALAAEEGMELGAWGEREGLERYLGSSLKGEAAIDWDDAEARQALLAAIVGDADRLLERARQVRGELEAGSPADRAVVEAAELLGQVLLQDIERHEDDGDGDGEDGTGEPRIRRGVARDRVPSLTDPQMRHGRKSARQRFDGHKAQVAVDTESQLITAVAVLAGNAPDREQALEMVEASEAHTGCAVEETVADCAYGGGETRRAFADAGRRLVASVASVRNGGRFTKTDFEIDLEAESCTCPAGHTTTQLSRSARGGGRFRFPAALCQACPLRERCVGGRGGRTVSLHREEALLQEARALERSPEMREHRRRRQAAEHRLARLVQLGIRQARYLGRAKTLVQLLLAAMVANLTLLARAEHTAEADEPPMPAAA